MKRKIRRYRPYGRFAKLLKAALAVPSVASSLGAQAQELPEHPKLRLQYLGYEDYQSSSDRMEAYGPMVSLDTPLGEKTAFSGSLVYETISGASPLYLSTLSGASGVGIKDHRRAGDGKVTHNFDSFSLGLGGNFSNEDDYDSVGGSLEGKVWTPDKNTVFTVAVGGGHDDISATNNPEIDETRTNLSLLGGVTQVLNQRSLIQSNLTWNSGDGYFTDPYKLFDNRPSTRDQFAWLTRYVLYLPATEGSLHADYRFYIDSWELWSHMLELAVYHPLGENWGVKPNLRYYTQHRAEFFTQEFPPPDVQRFVSADQRLGQFGEIGAGLTVMRKLTESIDLDVHFEYFHQRPSLALGGGASDLIDSFSGRLVLVGITKSFM